MAKSTWKSPSARPSNPHFFTTAMKTKFRNLTASLCALTLAFFAPFSQAQDGGKQPEEAFGDLLEKALEDAVKGWDQGSPEFKEIENLLGRLFGDEGELSEEDLNKWLGGPLLNQLKKGLGEGEELNLDETIELGELEEFAKFLKGLGGLREPGDNEKENETILETYRPLSEKGSRSTTKVMLGKKQIALATVVSENGFLLTKASELDGKDTFTCSLSGGLEIDARLVDVHAPYDLALLKVDADGLTPVDWNTDTKTVQAGSFILAPGIDSLPLAVGVVSVLPRSLSESDKGFLGVQLEPRGELVGIRAVVPGSPADKSGLQAGDLILKLENKDVKSVLGFIDEVKTRSPQDTISIRYRRGDDEKEIKVTLADRTMVSAGSNPGMNNPFNALGGRLSSNRGGYPMALQTDLTLRPEECGGPLLDLEGKAIGINIARSGRVMSYAIPASAIRDLLGDLPGGKFAKRDLKALNDELGVAQRKLKAARTAFETAEKQLDAAKKALDEAIK